MFISDIPIGSVLLVHFVKEIEDDNPLPFVSHW
jgi:hypothetical protein